GAANGFSLELAFIFREKPAVLVTAHRHSDEPAIKRLPLAYSKGKASGHAGAAENLSHRRDAARRRIAEPARGLGRSRRVPRRNFDRAESLARLARTARGSARQPRQWPAPATARR